MSKYFPAIIYVYLFYEDLLNPLWGWLGRKRPQIILKVFFSHNWGFGTIFGILIGLSKNSFLENLRWGRKYVSVSWWKLSQWYRDGGRENMDTPNLDGYWEIEKVCHIF